MYLIFLFEYKTKGFNLFKLIYLAQFTKFFIQDFWWKKRMSYDLKTACLYKLFILNINSCTCFVRFLGAINLEVEIIRFIF